MSTKEIAMRFLPFKPFSKEKLIEDLSVALPHHKIQHTFGTLQVRTSGFTISGNVVLKCNPKEGWIRTQTNYDHVLVYLIVMFPIGLYLLSKKRKALDLENLVVDKLSQLLESREERG